MIATAETTPVRPEPPARRWSRRFGAIGVALLAVVALSGCLQLNAQMTVRKDDTVSGRILIAGTDPAETSVLDRLQTPTGLSEKVRMSNYSANGYSGKEIYFTQLTFTEVEALSSSFDLDGKRPYRLSFSRSGSAVDFSGMVDLSGIPADKAQGASARIDLTFPAPVTKTNGDRGSGNSVSWSPKAGAVTRMDATSDYPDPATRGFAVWMIVGVGAALLVSIGTILAARASRARADHLTKR